MTFNFALSKREPGSATFKHQVGGNLGARNKENIVKYFFLIIFELDQLKKECQKHVFMKCVLLETNLVSILNSQNLCLCYNWAC